MLDHAAGDIDEDAAAVVLGGLSAVCPRLSPKLGGGRRMVTVRVRLCGVGPCANYCGTSASFERRWPSPTAGGRAAREILARRRREPRGIVVGPPRPQKHLHDGVRGVRWWACRGPHRAVRPLQPGLAPILPGPTTERGASRRLDMSPLQPERCGMGIIACSIARICVHVESATRFCHARAFSRVLCRWVACDIAEDSNLILSVVGGMVSTSTPRTYQKLKNRQFCCRDHKRVLQPKQGPVTGGVCGGCQKV